MLKNLKNRLNENKGFSLVELIVVIAIMVILIALLVPNVVGYISKAQDAANLSAAKSIYNAVNTAVIDFKAQHGKYPNPEELKKALTTDVKDASEKLVVVPEGTAVAIGYNNGNVWAVAAGTTSGDLTTDSSTKNLQAYSPLGSGNCYMTATEAGDQPYIADLTNLTAIKIKGSGTGDTRWTNGDAKDAPESLTKVTGSGSGPSD